MSGEDIGAPNSLCWAEAPPEPMWHFPDLRVVTLAVCADVEGTPQTKVYMSPTCPFTGVCCAGELFLAVGPSHWASDTAMDMSHGQLQRKHFF